MKRPAPDTFPHKSRAAIAEFLTRDGRYYRPTRYRFAWNVKTYSARFDGDTMRKHDPNLRPEFDSKWQKVLDADSSLFWMFCEDGARWVSGGEWYSYPGDDQGDWEFTFEGRSGGWLALTKWRGRDMRDPEPDDFLNADEWPWPDLVKFYRGIRCADSDFTTAKAAAEVEYHAADYRGQLESEWLAERNAAAYEMAEAMAAARPDLAPIWEGAQA